jgi:hypothetical protein
MEPGRLGIDSWHKQGLFFENRPFCPVDTGSVITGFKTPERKHDLSSPSKAEIKSAWIYSPPLHGVKRRQETVHHNLLQPLQL